MTRTVDTRFFVLRDGAIVTELYAIGAPSLRMNSEGDIKISLAGDFLENPAVDWLNDEVQPVLLIDGEETPLGILSPATVRHNTDETTKSVHVEMYDRCWKVKNSLTEDHFYIKAGTNYITAIEQQLVAAGISLVQSTPTAETLDVARENADLGISRLTIINQLLSEINYNPLWFNEQGLAVLEPASVPAAENIDHTLDGEDVRSLLLPATTSEMDIYDAPNVFICICSSPDRSTTYTARAENTNPQSPLSIPRRGRRIVKVTKVNNMASSAALANYAKRLRNESMMRSEVITVETGLLPGFGPFDVTAINYGDLSGVCLETAWTMELTTGGAMQHTLRKVVYAFE